MKIYSGLGLGDIYFEMLRDITEHGRKIETRHGPCCELREPVAVEYLAPGHCWMNIPGRKFNPFLALAEVLWILSGSGSVEWITYFSKSLKQFQDGTNEYFHGAYGLRIRRALRNVVTIDQLDQVVMKLKENPYSRQAIISLWDPYLDNIIESRDYPCNNWVGYTLRDGVLDQTVVIRSNDLVWGTPMNAVQFTYIQAYVAGRLGVKPGKFVYIINNLHYYLDLYKPTLACLLDRAYDSNKILYSEKIVDFNTFGDKELNSCIAEVDDILTFYHERQSTHLSKMRKTPPEQRSLGHLGTFSLGIRVFCAIKEKAWVTERVAEWVNDLGNPLKNLIVDFYESSSNEFAQQVISILRGDDGVGKREGDVLQSS